MIRKVREQVKKVQGYLAYARFQDISSKQIWDQWRRFQGKDKVLVRKRGSKSQNNG